MTFKIEKYRNGHSTTIRLIDRMRPNYETEDMIKQHEFLCEIAAMVDSGSLRTTLGVNLGTINAASLKKAHEKMETGRTRGMIVFAGF